jgi:hypothetical protein
MRISIKSTPKAAAEILGESQESKETRSVVAAVQRAGAALQPMHPGTDDDELLSYFYADVDDERVEELLKSMEKSDAIEGAYIKPPDALP